MVLKQFRNKYGLELISASNENIILGTLVWDPLVGKPDFDHPGMPNHIFNAFIGADLLNEEEFLSHLEEGRKTELVQAKFAERVIDVEVGLSTSLEHPKIGKIKNGFSLEKIKKFTFGDLKARTMTDLLRVRIDDYLEELKKNKWDEYDGKIRRVYMITELYYGSINLVIDKEFKNEFEASLNQADLEISNTLEFSKSVEYTFNHDDVPFAMNIEKVKKFNA